jgi:hypothetical protein
LSRDSKPASAASRNHLTNKPYLAYLGQPQNFYYWRRAKVVQGAPRGWEGSKSFLVLFFKKEPFPY